MNWKRRLVIPMGLFAAAWPAACEQINWAKLFEDLSSGKSSLMQAATERFVDVVGPQLTTEKEDLAISAVSGVARMADARSEAADAVEKATESHSTARRVAAMKAIGGANVTGAKLVSRLGTLLNDHDDGIVRAALAAIGNLGAAAIRLNSPQIEELAENSSNKELVTLAHELLKQQAPQR